MASRERHDRNAKNKNKFTVSDAFDQLNDSDSDRNVEYDDSDRDETYKLPREQEELMGKQSLKYCIIILL